MFFLQLLEDRGAFGQGEEAAGSSVCFHREVWGCRWRMQEWMASPQNLPTSPRVFFQGQISLQCKNA